MKKGEKRIQNGIIHCYCRGNSRFRVFYDDVDCVVFLKKLQKALDKTHSSLLDFALMVNHFHLLVRTENVTELMGPFLQSYSRWYNQRHNMSNKLFASPFGSSAKNEEIKAFQLSTYILQNPLKANLCKKAEEYAWSSASMHFPNNMAISCMNASKYIKIDTSLYDSKFHSYKEFLNHINFIPDSSVRTEQKSVNNNVTLKKIGGDNSSQATGKTGMERRKVWKSEMGKSETEKFEVEKSEMEKFEVEKSEMEKSEMEKSEMGKSEMGKSEMEKSEMEKSEMEKIALECKEINSAQILGNAIFEYLIKNLGGKKLGDLTEEEEKGLIKTVFKKTDCKIVELANAVHESYNFVYRLLKKVKKFRRNFFT